MNGLRSFAVFDERELYFQFALVFPFDIFNCKLHV